MGDEIKAGTRVADPRGDGVDGRVVEVKGDEALVAFDDGHHSEWIPLRYLTPKVGRPAGSGVREPVTEPPTKAPFKRRFRAVLTEEMRRQQLTWDELARRAGVSRSTIGRVLTENDCGATATVEALARGLGIEPGRFWS